MGEIVAQQTETLPGFTAGETLANLTGSGGISGEQSPRIADDGSIFAEFRVSGTTPNRDAGYVIFPPAGDPVLVVREGDLSPAGGDSVIIQPTSVLNAYGADGTLVWMGQITGTGITTSNNDALFRHRNGDTGIAIREGTNIDVLTQSGGTTTLPFNQPSVNQVFTSNGGKLAFQQNGQLYREAVGGYQRYFRTGDMAAADGTWSTSVHGAMAPDGSFIGQTFSIKPPPTTSLSTYGFAAADSATSGILLRQSDFAPGSPTRVLETFNSLRYAASTEGRFAAIHLARPLEGFATPTLFVGTAGQSVERALQNGDPVPGLPGATVSGVVSCDAAGNHVIAWINVANGGGTTLAILKRTFDDPEWTMVMRSGQQADAPTGVAIGNFLRFQVAEDGTVALQAAVLSHPGGGSFATRGIFVHRKNRLELVAHIGMALPGGETIGTGLFVHDRGESGQNGGGRFMNSSGVITLRAPVFRSTAPTYSARDSILVFRPNDPPTNLEFTWQRIGNRIVITVPSEIGLSYVIEESDDLEVWTTPGTPIAGTGADLNLEASITPPGRKFFRVRAE